MKKFKRLSLKDYKKQLMAYAKSRCKRCRTCGHLVVNGFICEACGSHYPLKLNKKIYNQLCNNERKLYQWYYKENKE